MPFFMAFLSPPCWQMCWRSLPLMPINRGIIGEQRLREWECSRRTREKRRESGVAAMCSSVWEQCELSLREPPSSYIGVVNPPVSISNNIDFSCGCRQFAEPH